MIHRNCLHPNQETPNCSIYARCHECGVWDGFELTTTHCRRCGRRDFCTHTTRLCYDCASRGDAMTFRAGGRVLDATDTTPAGGTESEDAQRETLQRSYSVPASGAG